MIKIKKATKENEYKILLDFSDDSSVVVDFSYLFSFDTALTNPLKEQIFFDGFFLDAGALCWKHGLELNASSLYEKFVQSTSCAA